MKKELFIRDLKEGLVIREIFLVRKKVLKQTREGNDYYDLLLADKTGEIEAKVWSDSGAMGVEFDRGDFVLVTAKVDVYRQKARLIIEDMSRVDSSEVDMAVFVPTCPQDIDAMLDRLKNVVSGIDNEHLRALVDTFFSDSELVEKFKTAPGAVRMHHTYIGGLLEHTLSVAGLIELICKHYPDLNRDLLLVSALLHDIGLSLIHI